jgi:hypothetical protein
VSAAIAGRSITCALLSFLLSADRFWVGGAALFRACRACCVLGGIIDDRFTCTIDFAFLRLCQHCSATPRRTVRTAPIRQRRRACSACADDGSSSCDRQCVPFRPRARFQYNQTSERTKVVSACAWESTVRADNGWTDAILQEEIN